MKHLPGSAFFFYVRKAPDNGLHRAPFDGEIELHLRDKTSYFCSEGGPDDSLGLAYAMNIDISPIGEMNDADGNVSWWQGDVDNARQHLLSLGMTENEDLVVAYDLWVERYVKDREKRWAGHDERMRKLNEERNAKK